MQISMSQSLLAGVNIFSQKSKPFPKSVKTLPQTFYESNSLKRESLIIYEYFQE